MNKRIKNKIAKRQANEKAQELLKEQTAVEAKQADMSLSARVRDEVTHGVAKALDQVKHEVTKRAGELEKTAEKLLEKVPFVGEKAAEKLHDLTTPTA